MRANANSPGAPRSSLLARHEQPPSSPALPAPALPPSPPAPVVAVPEPPVPELPVAELPVAEPLPALLEVGAMHPESSTTQHRPVASQDGRPSSIAHPCPGQQIGFTEGAHPWPSSQTTQKPPGQSAEVWHGGQPPACATADPVRTGAHTNAIARAEISVFTGGSLKFFK